MALCKSMQSPCVFKELYLVQQRERQLKTYSLDLCVSYSTFLATFMVHNGFREALIFA